VVFGWITVLEPLDDVGDEPAGHRGALVVVVALAVRQAVSCCELLATRDLTTRSRCPPLCIPVRL